MNTVLGDGSGELLKAPTGDGTDYKYDAKGGNDIVIASTGDDLLIGGSGSDVLFGGAGKDTFLFDKFAASGDVDIITDFHIGQDTLLVKNGASIIGLDYGFFGDTTANGYNLSNDSKVMDAKLTLQIDDGDKHFTQEVILLDVIKNSGWSLDQFKQAIGWTGPVGHAWTEVAAS